MKPAICIGALTLAVSGCGAPGSNPTALAPPAAAAHQTHHQRSWMMDEASSEDLLYIADSFVGGIDVYSDTPPKYKLVGVLMPPNSYTNICVNKAQSVFAVTYNYVIEYKHGATGPQRILGGLNEYSYGCAVDPMTGTLAVTTVNQYPPLQDVAFFKKAHGTNTKIALPEGFKVGTKCAYDENGNLFVEAYTAGSSPRFALMELPAETKQFIEVALDKSLAGIGALMWDGTYLDIADPQSNVIYELAIARRKGTIEGRIVLHATYDIGGFFVDGTTLVASGFSKPPTSRPSGREMVNFYDYPAGGKKTGVIHGVGNPLSVVVSLAKTGNPRH